MNKKLGLVVLVLPALVFLAIAYFNSTGSEDIPLVISTSSDWQRSEPPFALSPDNTLIATINQTALYDYDVTIFDLNARGDGPFNLPKGEGQPVPSFITFTPDGTQLIAAGSIEYFRGGSIYVWDISTGQQPRKMASGQVWGDAALSTDGKTLVYGTKEGSLALFNMVSEKTVGSVASGKKSQLISVALSADGKQMAASYRNDQDSTVTLWNFITKKKLWTQKFR